MDGRRAEQLFGFEARTRLARRDRADGRLVPLGAHVASVGTLAPLSPPPAGASRTLDGLLEHPRAVLGALFAGAARRRRSCSPPRFRTTAGSGSTTATRSGSRPRAGCSGTSSFRRPSSATCGRSSSPRSCGSRADVRPGDAARSWRSTSSCWRRSRSLCVYGIAERIGGRLLGYWASLLWVVAPFASIPLFVDRYQERWTENFLPQALGLTSLSDFPSMVVVLAAALFIVRSLDAGRVAEAALAGLLLGAAGAMKPPNLLLGAGRGARVPGRASLAGGDRLRRGGRPEPARARPLEGARPRRASGALDRGGCESQPVRGCSRSTSTATSSSTSTTGACRWISSASSSGARGLPSGRRSPALLAVLRVRRAPDRGAARRLAGRVPRREGLLHPRGHPGEHLLAAPHARLAGVPDPLRVDPAARADPRPPTRRPPSAGFRRVRSPGVGSSVAAVLTVAIPAAAIAASSPSTRPERAVFQDDVGNYIMTPIAEDVTLRSSPTADAGVDQLDVGRAVARQTSSTASTGTTVAGRSSARTPTGRSPSYCFIRSLPIATTRDTHVPRSRRAARRLVSRRAWGRTGSTTRRRATCSRSAGPRDSVAHPDTRSSSSAIRCASSTFSSVSFDSTVE